MSKKSENKKAAGLFKQVADVIRVNGWQPTPPSGAWHFKGTDLLEVPGTLASIASGATLLVYLFPAPEPGVVVEFRKGGLAELAALLTSLAEHVAAGPAGSRPGEFPAGHKLAVNPPRESGFEYFKATPTSGKTSGNPASEAEGVNDSAAPSAPGGLIGNEATR